MKTVAGDAHRWESKGAQVLRRKRSRRGLRRTDGCGEAGLHGGNISPQMRTDQQKRGCLGINVIRLVRIFESIWTCNWSERTSPRGSAFLWQDESPSGEAPRG